MLKAFIFSSFWIALGAATLSSANFITAHNSAPSFALTFLVFGITFVSYSLQRASSVFMNKQRGPIGEWTKDNFKFVIFSGSIIALGTCFAFLKVYNPSIWIPVLPAVLISGLYTLGSVRDIPGIKIILISVSWALVLAYLPLLEANPSTIAKKFAEEFFFIVAITIPFDIRDLPFDEKSKKTIPQLIGVYQSKLISILLIVISSFIHLYEDFTIGFLIFSILCILVILGVKPKRKEFYYTGLLDGFIFLKGIFIIFLTDFNQ
ncbi:MAG: hypothetical protein MRY83_07915 [Flavobacteriales bacterium]|nr:hypothetical protein [Flavobacteriales bacterium]